MTLKKVLKILLALFVLIPNLPFVIFFGLYIIVQIFINTNPVEMEMILEDDDVSFMTPEIREYVKTTYSKPVQYFVAAMFYMSAAMWWGF